MKTLMMKTLMMMKRMKKMMTEIVCPRRVESGMANSFPEPDIYREEDDKCSYCGSLNPDTFMKRLEAGDIELGPTDKNYKAYVENKGGQSFKQHYRDCYTGKEDPGYKSCTGPDDCTHWITREQEHGKFYFQHLSVEQRKRFVELLNEKKLHIGMPGHFYTRLFFIAPPVKE